MAEFEALFRETRGPLLAYLTRRAPSEDAADLLADVYLVAWRRRGAESGSGGHFSYSCTFGDGPAPGA